MACAPCFMRLAGASRELSSSARLGREGAWHCECGSQQCANEALLIPDTLLRALRRLFRRPRGCSTVMSRVVPPESAAAEGGSGGGAETAETLAARGFAVPQEVRPSVGGQALPRLRELPEEANPLLAFRCPICFSTCTEPVSTACGHNFCLSCFTEWRAKRNECAVCRAPVAKTLVVNRAIQSAIEAIKRISSTGLAPNVLHRELTACPQAFTEVHPPLARLTALPGPPLGSFEDPVHSFIYVLLEQVHPGFYILPRTSCCVADALRDVMQRLITCCVELSAKNATGFLTPKHMESAVQLVLPGELGKHAKSASTKAITKFNTSSDKNASLTTQAGLYFSVYYFWRRLRERAPGLAVTVPAAISLAAVSEYLCAELLELAGNAVKLNSNKTIMPWHFMFAIRGDEELDTLFYSCEIAYGGVIPHIHRSLTDSNWERNGAWRFARVGDPLFSTIAARLDDEDEPAVCDAAFREVAEKYVTLHAKNEDDEEQDWQELLRGYTFFPGGGGGALDEELEEQYVRNHMAQTAVVRRLRTGLPRLPADREALPRERFGMTEDELVNDIRTGQFCELAQAHEVGLSVDALLSAGVSGLRQPAVPQNPPATAGLVTIGDLASNAVNLSLLELPDGAAGDRSSPALVVQLAEDNDDPLEPPHPEGTFTVSDALAVLDGAATRATGLAAAGGVDKFLERVVTDRCLPTDADLRHERCEIVRALRRLCAGYPWQALEPDTEAETEPWPTIWRVLGLCERDRARLSAQWSVFDHNALSKEEFESQCVATGPSEEPVLRREYAAKLLVALRDLDDLVPRILRLKTVAEMEDEEEEEDEADFGASALVSMLSSALIATSGAPPPAESNTIQLPGEVVAAISAVQRAEMQSLATCSKDERSPLWRAKALRLLCDVALAMVATNDAQLRYRAIRFASYVASYEMKVAQDQHGGAVTFDAAPWCDPSGDLSTTIPPLDFQQLVAEISHDLSTDVGWTAEALEALQVGAEAYLRNLFEDTQLEAIHRRSKRSRPEGELEPRDMLLARRLRGERV